MHKIEDLKDLIKSGVSYNTVIYDGNAQQGQFTTRLLLLILNELQSRFCDGLSDLYLNFDTNMENWGDLLLLARFHNFSIHCEKDLNKLGDDYYTKELNCSYAPGDVNLAICKTTLGKVVFASF